MDATAEMQDGADVPDKALSTAAFNAADIRALVARMLNSPPFKRAPRISRLLAYLVDESLAGRSAQLKEYTIATDVFGKPSDFVLGTSAVVRVEAGRLRQLLAKYRADHSAGDRLEIEVPKGSYVPKFKIATAAPTRTFPSGDGGTDLLRDQFDAPPACAGHFVTVLCCAPSGPEGCGAFEPSCEVRELCATIAQACGGELTADASEGLAVFFGLSRPLEDAPGRALTAAIHMLAAAGARVGKPHLQVGVATGKSDARRLAAVPQARGAPDCEVRDLADSLRRSAPLGGVLVAETTRRLTVEAFDFVIAAEPAPEGGGDLRWRLLGSRHGATRFQARHEAGLRDMVGRREEIELLMSRWRLSATGEGQGVLVLGEAGIGKSRLIEAALQRIRRGGVPLRLQCSPYHANSALFPVVELLKARLDPRRWRRGAKPIASRFLGKLGVRSEADQAVLHDLISGHSLEDSSRLAASERKGRTLELFRRMVAALTEIRPVILLVEDIQWADPTTLEILQDIVQRARLSRLLVVITGRLEGMPAFAQQTNVTVLKLARLPRADCAELIDQLAPSRQLSPPARALIIDRADGNPLFVEELTKHILVDGSHPERSVLPDTLSDLLAAQLGRLGPVRDLAQVAAVLGRSFSSSMLALAAQRAATETESALDRLSRAGILIRDRSAAAETYKFRHTLIRDAAYASLPEARRRSLHLHIGDMLLESFPTLAADQPEVVAHHLLEGGRAEDSVPFWYDAGRRALARYALTEAMAHLRAALGALEHRAEAEPRDRELSLLVLLGASEAFMGHFAAARELQERACALYDPDRDGACFGFEPGALAPAYLSWIVWHMGERSRANRLAARALEEAQQRRILPVVLSWLLFLAICNDDLQAVVRYGEMLPDACAQFDNPYWAPFGLASAEWAAFEHDQKPERLERFLAHIEAFEGRYLTSCLLVLAARMCLTLNRTDRGLELIDAAFEFIEKHDERIWQAEAARIKAELLRHSSSACPDRVEASFLEAIDIARGQGAIELERRARRSQAQL